MTFRSSRRARRISLSFSVSYKAAEGWLGIETAVGADCGEIDSIEFRFLHESIPCFLGATLASLVCPRQDASLSHSSETGGFSMPSSTGEQVFPRPPSCSIPAGIIFTAFICPRQESNLHQLVRSEPFYPLNYGGLQNYYTTQKKPGRSRAAAGQRPRSFLVLKN